MNKDFTRARIDSLTLGERLAKLRESHELDINELSKNIKIRRSYIRALESGDYQSLPTKVYTRGFINAYARYFNVSEEKLARIFDREYQIYKNIHRKNEPQVEEITRLPALPKIVLTSKTIIAVITILIISAAGGYLYFGFKKFVSAPWLKVEEPAGEVTTKEQEITIKGSTQNDARVFINDQLIQVGLDGVFIDEVGLSPGVNNITVKSINKFDKETVENITVHAEYKEVTREEEEETADETHKISLKIKAEEKTIWMKVVADDIEVYSDILRPEDEEKEFFAKEKIVVSSNDGKNTLTKFNDAEEFSNLSTTNKAIDDVVFEAEEEVEDDSEATAIPEESLSSPTESDEE